MLNLFIEEADLKLFDGGAVGGDGGASGGGNGNDGQGIAQPATSTKKGGAYDNVVFGKAESTADDVQNVEPTPQAEPTLEERQKAYDDFIKANKDLYQKDFQKNFNRRHADYKDLQEKFGKADKLIGLIAERYGENNVDKLEELIANDTRLLEDEAIEKGIPVDQLIEIKKLKRTADIERLARERIENQRKGEEQYNRWLADAEKVRATYPDFNLEAEVQNPQFTALLQNGVDMAHAYKVLHYDELMETNVNLAMKKASKATVDSITARGNRPKENAGNTSSSGVIYKSDVSKLTKEDREEIARRAMRGEKISF